MIPSTALSQAGSVGIAGTILPMGTAMKHTDLFPIKRPHPKEGIQQQEHACLTQRGSVTARLEQPKHPCNPTQSGTILTWIAPFVGRKSSPSTDLIVLGSSKLQYNHWEWALDLQFSVTPPLQSRLLRLNSRSKSP